MRTKPVYSKPCSTGHGSRMSGDGIRAQQEAAAQHIGIEKLALVTAEQ